jgi:hypothetical protein
MSLTASATSLTAKDREEIDRWIDAYGTPQQVVLRSRIVLAAAEGQSDSAVARDLEINRKTVTLWRVRFAQEGLIVYGKKRQVEGANPPLARRKSKPSSTRRFKPSPRG